MVQLYQRGVRRIQPIADHQTGALLSRANQDCSAVGSGVTRDRSGQTKRSKRLATLVQHGFAKILPYPAPGPGGTGPLGTSVPSLSCSSLPFSAGEKMLTKWRSLSARSVYRSPGPTL
jgi:hypothetical protein